MKFMSRSTPVQKRAVLRWIVQGLLALVFLFAGGMRLVLPVGVMTKQMPLPGVILRFTGVAEILGAIGLTRRPASQRVSTIKMPFQGKNIEPVDFTASRST